jgi:polysaccharide deacetylase 2 family uncharacterized protein YibQ
VARLHASARRREIRGLVSKTRRRPPSFFPFFPKSGPFPTLLLATGFALAAWVGGCRKAHRPLRASEIHAISREFVAAASSTLPGGSRVRSDSGASDDDPESTDSVDIPILGDASQASRRASVTRVLQWLGGVATRRGLTQDAPSESHEAIVFRYRRGGFATHTIRIHSAPAVTPQDVPAHDQARLAIILDDLGNDRAAAEAIFRLSYPLTISVLPNQAHSVEIADQAHRRGYQVMLHLPMESVGQGRPESQQLRPGMSSNEVIALVNGFLRAVPDVAGVNNHQGSQSTADVALMDELMPVLREHRLFYVDSRTTAATVAYEAAQRAGVQSGFRNVPFLDDVADLSAVRKQLRLALREAGEKGEGIAIGHPHPATLQALSEVLPEARAQGIRLVFASELVH